MPVACRYCGRSTVCRLEASGAYICGACVRRRQRYPSDPLYDAERASK